MEHRNAEEEALPETDANCIQYSELCIVGRDLTEFNVLRYGSFIRRIDLSFNLIQKLKGLSICAETLEELILDNNQLERLELATIFPKLHTLSINKNRIWNLDPLLKDLTNHAFNLTYLSLLGNPIVPDQLSSDYVQESDYQDYRYTVLYHLPPLKFLDHRIVSAQERKESTKILYGTSNRIKPTLSPLPPSNVTITNLHQSTWTSDNNSDIVELEQIPEPIVQLPQRRKSKQGKRRTKYVGKNSEGNRFIKDSDL